MYPTYECLPVHADTTQELQTNTAVKAPDANAGPNTTTADPVPTTNTIRSISEFDALYSPENLIVPDTIFERPQLIRRIPWAATDAVHTDLTAGGIPIQSSLLHLTTSGAAVNNPQARFLSAYHSWKADIEVTVWVNGNANCAGLLQFATRFDQNANAIEFCSSCCDPFKTYLSPQSDQKVKFIIPYKSARWRRNGNDQHDAWGRLYCFIVHPLVSAASLSPPDIEIVITATFLKPRIQGPTMVAYQSAVSFKKEAASMIKSGVDMVTDALPGSKVAIKVAKGIGKLVAPEFVKTLESWGFNKPPQLTQIQRFKTMNGNSPYYRDGYSPDFGLGVGEASSIEQIPDPMGNDFTDYKAYCAISSFCQTFTIDNTVNPDDIVATLPVLPHYGPTDVPSAGNTRKFMGPVQWAAHKHAFWRGTINYQVYLSAPVGVTGTLRISRKPEVSGLSPSVPSQDAGDIVSTTIDFKGDTMFRFSVPHSSHIPAFASPQNLARVATRPYNTNGILQFSTVNKLNNPLGVATTVYCSVFMTLAPDFEFYGLRDDSSVTYQSLVSEGSEVKPLIPGVTAEADGFTNFQRYRSFRDIFRTPYEIAIATPVTLSPLLGHPLETKTFAAFRGSRVATFYTNSMCSAKFNWISRRIGSTVTISSSNVLARPTEAVPCYSHPYQSNLPYFMFQPEPITGGTLTDEVYTEAVIGPVATSATAFQTKYAGDDAQWFIPCWVPAIVVPDSVNTE